MPDLIDELFGVPEDDVEKINEYYPGSKRKRRPVNPAAQKKKVRVVQSDSWDAHPQIKKFPNGKELELFSMSALSAALGRPIVTLRLWERRGYIPRAPYRLKSMMVNGVKKPGWRMYSRDMIESAIEIFSNHGLLEARRVDWDQSRDATIALVDSWNKIHDQETH